MILEEKILDGFLIKMAVIFAFIVFIGFFNEKVTRLTYEISLMLFSIIIGGVLLIIGAGAEHVPNIHTFLEELHYLDVEKILMDGMLCFMLFAGSCHMRLLDFKKHAKTISLLAIGATFLGAVFYGILFYLGSRLLGLSLSVPECLMFGSIIAPTDPIAATSILKKFDLPSGIGFIIEGESLLNDGVGVALFVCFSGSVTAQSGGGFFFIMIRELLGAALIGTAVTMVCFPIFRRTGDESRRIFTSLFAVSLAYVLCEAFGASGAIASVVCGVLFSALRNRQEEQGDAIPLEQFDIFWGILDTLLNSVLYVMLGLSFLHILQMSHVLLVSALAILINLLSRAGSVGIAALSAGTLPDGYDKISFVRLLTWGGLRGGLSIALAMSTQDILAPEVYHIVLGGTFAVAFFTTVVQGMTMKNVYQKIQAGLE